MSLVTFFKKFFKRSTPQIVEELSDAQLNFLKVKNKQLMNYVSTIADKRNRENQEKVKLANSSCPKCQSTNVNDRIKRFQGKIDGKSNGYGWNALTFGESYSSGYVKGDFDTNEVNKCNDCEHEWKKSADERYVYASSIIASELNFIRYFFRDLHKARHEVKWDKNDLNETFKSLADKKDHALKSVLNGTWKSCAQRFWADYPIELIERLAKEHLTDSEFRNWKQHYDLKVLKDVLKLRSIKEFSF